MNFSKQRRIATISLVVDDYDRAIDFYVKKLGFKLIEDTQIGPDKRWVIVRPSGSLACDLLLAKAKNENEKAAIGNQSGGRVFLFLETEDLNKDFTCLLKNKVEIIREPITQAYGKVLVFADLYGNKWDLIERIKPTI